ncbi:MAG TPA: hypothetical protein VF666_07075 [Pyrinomonadaceae bacterium]|jgi:hypothetical protein
MTTIIRRAFILLLLVSCMVGLYSTAEAKQNPESTVAVSSSENALRSAQTIYIRTKSVYFKPAALEQALLDRDEFQMWGFAISREESDADLILEVDRKLFTNKFIYSVIDPQTKRVLLGGKIGSLGGTVEGQIADGFIKRLRRVRPFGAAGRVK